MAQPDFARVHVELRRKGVTLTLLWDPAITRWYSNVVVIIAPMPLSLRLFAAIRPATALATARHAVTGSARAERGAKAIPAAIGPDAARRPAPKFGRARKSERARTFRRRSPLWEPGYRKRVIYMHG